MNDSSKKEKTLTDNESARLYFIGLMNPSDKELEEWSKGWDIDHPEENVKVAMDLGKLAWEQEMSSEEALLQGIKDAVVSQEQIDSEVEENMNSSLKTEKIATLSKPKEMTLVSFKEWIMSLTATLTGQPEKNDLTDAEWLKLFKDYQKENVRVTMDLGKMESEQYEDLMDKYIEAARSVKAPQSVLDREAAEQEEIDSKVEE